MNHLYVIIAGTTKAGTTSLFNYLSDHEEVCGSVVKETGFFLDEDYLNPPEKIYDYRDGIEKYHLFFPCRNENRILLEATPGYLYSWGTPRRIKDLLKNVKIIIILRDPIDRLVSSYRFEKQTGRIRMNMTFDQFVLTQLEKGRFGNIRDLETGRYANYLEKYFETFDSSELLVLPYEGLRDNTIQMLKKAASFCGIDKEFYKKYRPQIYNRTMTFSNPFMHRLYLTISLAGLRRKKPEKALMQKVLKTIKSKIDWVFQHLNRQADEEVYITSDIREKLEFYYRSDMKKLCELFKKYNVEGNFTWLDCC